MSKDSVTYTNNPTPIAVNRINFDITKIKTNLNPFISKDDKDYREVVQILNKDKPKIKRGFTKNEEIRLNELAKLRSIKNGFFGNFFLYSFKFIAILIHPLNSWGWPISLTLEARYSVSDFYMNLKIFFKLLLFIYRILLFYFYFRNIYSFINSLKLRTIFSNYNKKLIKDNLILISSFTLLIIDLFLYIVLFGFLEHRYLYPIIPWIEYSVISNFLVQKKSIYNLIKKNAN